MKKFLSGVIKNAESPLAEETREQKEAAPHSLPSHALTQQKKADHSALALAAKKKRNARPFVIFALGLMLVFTSLCILSVLIGRPVASANSAQVLDATTTTYNVPPAPKDQSVQDLLEIPGAETLGPGSGYDTTNCPHPYDTFTSDSFCWNEMDFSWNDRDVTCIVNQSFPGGDPSKGNSWSLTMVDYQDNPVNVTLPQVALNQNTCLDNSVCVSNNASHTDNSNTLGDQISGDDILCANKDCINDTTGGQVPSQKECGDPSGPQREFDRFACQATSNTTSELQDNNLKSPGLDETYSYFHEYTWWWSNGLYINPTAYNPNGAIYLPTENLRAADIGPAELEPQCDTTDHWACSNGGALAVYQYNGSVSEVNSSYQEVVPNYKPEEVQGKDPLGNQSHDLWEPGSERVPVYWVVCGGSGGWAFPCSDKSGSNYPVSEEIISTDWLSGNADPTLDNASTQPGPGQVLTQEPGHLVYTYLNDTVNQPGVHSLSSFALAAGFALIAPVLVLIGYQFIWASWTLGRANALEALGRMILSILAILVSGQVAAMLIQLTDSFNLAIVALHARLGYPELTVNGYTTIFTLKNQGENDPASFRGIVIPISRWGCIANDFASILASKFWTDMTANIIPFFGGFIQLGGAVADAEDMVHNMGEFVMLLLTINLCAQVFMRLILLNYYILTGPLAFGCWGLPGGMGQRVVQSWAKGFISLLLAQSAQLFVLATFPLIVPALPQNIPIDNFGILQNFLIAIPRILVILAVIKVPKFMGTGATKAIAQAGTVAGGVVAAAAGAAYSTV